MASISPSFSSPNLSRPRLSSSRRLTTCFRASLDVRCQLVEPLRSDNGVPSRVPILLNGALSKAFSVPSVQDIPGRSDTRLRIFSGTANPALSQVNLPSKVKFLIKRGRDLCSFN